MKNFKRVVGVFFLMIILMTFTVSAADTSKFIDFPDNWSTEALVAAVDNGLMQGDANNRIEPDREITRAEFAAILVRAFGAVQEADISNVADVKPDDWFYTEVARAYKMGAITGRTETTFDPYASITREEAFTILARVLCFLNEDVKVLDAFTDKANISEYAVNHIANLLTKGYIDGYPDGTLLPGGNITRAETAQLFHNIFKTYISTPGYHSLVNPVGAVIVRSGNSNLEKVTINGDLVIADGIGSLPFELNSVTVNGRILFRAGAGGVTLKNVTVTDGIVVCCPTGIVRFENYRTETPFVNLRECTEAKFKTQSGPTGSIGGGTGPVVTKKYVYIYNADGSHETYDFTGSSYKLPETKVPDTSEGDFLGWNVYDENRDLVKEKISKAELIQEPLYKDYRVEPVFRITIDLSGDTALTPLVKESSKLTVKLDASDIPVITSDNFAYWQILDENDAVVKNNITTSIGITSVEFKNGYSLVAFFESKVVVYDENSVYKTVTVVVSNPNPEISLEDGDVPNLTDTETHTFKGWNIYADGSDTPKNAEPLTKTALLNEVLAKGDTVKPVYDEKTITVTVYDADNNGTPVTLGATGGYKLTASQVPDIADTTTHTFDGWNIYANGSDTPKNANPLTKTELLNEVLADGDSVKPVMTLRPSTDISVKLYDETGAYTTVTLTQAAGYKLTADQIPDYTDTETHTFKGWNIYADGSDTPKNAEPLSESALANTPLANGDSVKPVYDEKTITVTVYDADNAGTPVTLGATGGYKLTASQVPDIADTTTHTFDGWNIYADGSATPKNANPLTKTELLNEVLADGDSVKPVMTLRPSTDISVKLYDETGAYTTVTLTQAAGFKLTADQIPDYTDTETHTFKGWNIYADGSDTPKNAEPLSESVLANTPLADGDSVKPVYDEKTITVTVYDADNNGTPVTLGATGGYKLTASQVPDIADTTTHTFDGWNIYADGSATPKNANPLTKTELLNEVLADGDSVKPVMTLRPSTDISVKLYDETGAYTTVTLTQAAGYKLTADQIPDYTDTETHTFKGWNIYADGSDTPKNAEPLSESVLANTPLADGDSVKPVYDEKTITVTVYDADNNGTPVTLGATGGYKLTASQVPDIADTTTHTFDGWNIYADGSATPKNANPLTKTELLNEVLADGDSVKPVMTLRPSTDISVKLYDETGAYTTVTLTQAAGYKLTADQIPDYTDTETHTFKGWNIYADGSDTPKNAQPLSESVLANTPLADGDSVKPVYDEKTITVTVYDADNNGTPVTLGATGGYKLTADQIPDLADTDTYKFSGWNVYADGSDTPKNAEPLSESALTNTALEDGDNVRPVVTYTVTFYNDLGYKKYSKTKDLTTAIGYPAIFMESDIPSHGTLNPFPEDGYHFGSYVHSIEYGWWYEKTADKWTEFAPGEDGIEITSHTDVYRNSKRFTINVAVPKLTSSIMFNMNFIYNNETRAMDTLKDLLYVNASYVDEVLGVARNSVDKDEKVINKLEEKGIIDVEVVGDKEVFNIIKFQKYVKLVDILGEQRIKDMIFDVVGETINAEELIDWICDNVGSMNAEQREEFITLFVSMFEGVMESEDPNADYERDELKKVIKAYLNNMPADDLKEVVDVYITTRLTHNEEEVDQVKALLEKMLNSYASYDSAALVDEISRFATDLIEKNNSTIINSIKSSITEEVKNDISTTIQNAIKNGDAAELKKFATQISTGLTDANKISSIVITVADNTPDVITSNIKTNLVNGSNDTKKSFIHSAINSDSAEFDKMIADMVGIDESVVSGMANSEIIAEFDNYVSTNGWNGVGTVIEKAVDVIMNVGGDTAKKTTRDNLIKTYVNDVYPSGSSDDDKDARYDFAYDLVEMLVGDADNKGLLDTNPDLNDMFMDTVNKVVADTIDVELDAKITAIKTGTDTTTVPQYAKDTVDEKNFDIITDTFVILDETTRNTLINNILDKIYGTPVFDQVADEMISEIFALKTIDRNIVGYVVDHLGDSEEAINELTIFIDEVLKDENLLQEIAGTLGLSQSQHVNELIEELTSETGTTITITKDKLFMFELIVPKLQEYKYFDDVSDRIPEKLLKLLPKEMIDNIYKKTITAYVENFEKAVADVQNDVVPVAYVGNGVDVVINPITDVISPLFDYALDMETKVVDGKLKADYEVLHKYYTANPYRDEYESYFTVDKWFAKTGAETDTDTGYDLLPFTSPDFLEDDSNSYYENMADLLILFDETMTYYYNNVKTNEEWESIARVMTNKLFALTNIIIPTLEDYARGGIPTTYAELVEDLEDILARIETDPELAKYLKKFGYEKYLDKIAGIDKAENAYDKAYDKAAARVEALLKKFSDSVLNREYDEGEQEKILEVMTGLFTTDKEKLYTIDVLFDKFFGGKDVKIFGKEDGNHVEFKRDFVIAPELRPEN